MSEIIIVYTFHDVFFASQFLNKKYLTDDPVYTTRRLKFNLSFNMYVTFKLRKVTGRSNVKPQRSFILDYKFRSMRLIKWLLIFY